MNLKDYLSQKRGRLSALAKKINAHPPDVSRWASGERPVPVKFVVSIVGSTNGEVSAKELRPNDWQLYWPELTEEVA